MSLLTYAILAVSLFSWITAAVLFFKSDDVAPKVYAGIAFFINLVIFAWTVYTIYNSYNETGEQIQTRKLALERMQENEDIFNKERMEGREKRELYRDEMRERIALLGRPKPDKQ